MRRNISNRRNAGRNTRDTDTGARFGVSEMATLTEWADQDGEVRGRGLERSVQFSEDTRVETYGIPEGNNLNPLPGAAVRRQEGGAPVVEAPASREGLEDGGTAAPEVTAPATGSPQVEEPAPAQPAREERPKMPEMVIFGARTEAQLEEDLVAALEAYCFDDQGRAYLPGEKASESDASAEAPGHPPAPVTTAETHPEAGTPTTTQAPSDGSAEGAKQGLNTPPPTAEPELNPFTQQKGPPTRKLCGPGLEGFDAKSRAGIAKSPGKESKESKDSKPTPKAENSSAGGKDTPAEKPPKTRVIRRFSDILKPTEGPAGEPKKTEDSKPTPEAESSKSGGKEALAEKKGPEIRLVSRFSDILRKDGLGEEKGSRVSPVKGADAERSPAKKTSAIQPSLEKSDSTQPPAKEAGNLQPSSSKKASTAGPSRLRNANRTQPSPLKKKYTAQPSPLNKASSTGPSSSKKEDSSQPSPAKGTSSTQLTLKKANSTQPHAKKDSTSQLTPTKKADGTHASPAEVAKNAALQRASASKPPATPAASTAPDEHNPFEGPRGPPTFNNLTGKGLESFDAKSILGKKGAQRPTKEAKTEKSSVPSIVNDLAAGFGTWRGSSSQDDSSGMDSSEEDVLDDDPNDEDYIPSDEEDSNRWGREPERGDAPKVDLEVSDGQPGEKKDDSSIKDPGQEPKHDNRPPSQNANPADADRNNDAPCERPDGKDPESDVPSFPSPPPDSPDSDSWKDEFWENVKFTSPPPDFPGSWNSDFSEKYSIESLDSVDRYLVDPGHGNNDPQEEEQVPYDKNRVSSCPIYQPTVKDPDPDYDCESPTHIHKDKGPDVDSPRPSQPDTAKRPEPKTLTPPGRFHPYRPVGPGGALAGAEHSTPGTAPEWNPPVPPPAAQSTNSAPTVYGFQFQNTSAPGSSYRWSIAERGADFVRRIEGAELGLRGEPEEPDEGPRAVLIRRAERTLGSPHTWRISGRVSKRADAQPAGGSPVAQIRIPSRQAKPLKSAVKSGSRAPQTPVASDPPHLARPLQRAVDDHVNRHGERRRFTPPPVECSPPGHWEPEWESDDVSSLADFHLLFQTLYSGSDDVGNGEKTKSGGEEGALDEEEEGDGDSDFDTNSDSDRSSDEGDSDIDTRSDEGGSEVDRNSQEGGGAVNKGAEDDKEGEVGKQPDTKDEYAKYLEEMDPSWKVEAEADTPGFFGQQPPRQETVRRAPTRRERKFARQRGRPGIRPPKPRKPPFPSRPFSNRSPSAPAPKTPAVAGPEITTQSLGRLAWCVARRILACIPRQMPFTPFTLWVLTCLAVACLISVPVPLGGSEVHWYVARGEPRMWQAGC